MEYHQIHLRYMRQTCTCFSNYIEIIASVIENIGDINLHAIFLSSFIDMDNSLIMVRIDTNYCDYLRRFDSKVPYNYGEKEVRLFVGILFKIDKCMYFAPLSSPKPKHQRIKSNLDFFKLDSGKLGAINFNKMLQFQTIGREMY